MFDEINDKIIKILGIENLPIEKQKETMEKMGGIVYQEVMLRVLEIMSAEDKDAFEKLISENPDPQIMFAFLAEKVPSINDIVIEEAEKVRAESGEMTPIEN